MSVAPSMLTPVAGQNETCPQVDLPIPPNPKTDTCSENKSFVKFTDQVEKKGVGAAIDVGLAVDKRFVDILGNISNTLINGATLTAAYTALMLTFPDIEKKVNMYFEAAQKGWEAAQKKEKIDNGFSIGYIEYLIPSLKSQQKWIEDAGSETQISKDPLVRALAKGFRNPGINVTAKAITLAARAATATIRGVSDAVKDAHYDLTSDASRQEEEEEATESKIKRYSGYVDTISDVGKVFSKRKQYFNSTIPPYLQRIGPLAPYAILASLVSFASPGWFAGGVIAAAWPLITGAASWLITGSQVVDEIKSKAAIDSLEFVMLKLYDVLKSTKIPPQQYSDIFARLIVGLSCSAYVIREDDQQLFSAVDHKQVSILLYFLRYASYAYCLDPSTLAAADFADCVEINKKFSRRYYPIMQKVKGVKGFRDKYINFFLVYDLTLGCFVASFQGTTTLDDVLLDACGLPSALSFTDHSIKNPGATVTGYAHESMLFVAKNCVNLMIETLKEKHPFYIRVPIIVTGHSLGAGVAAISALLLREEGMQAYCVGIATPACLSPELASECKSFTVSVVNNSDIVPRLSECGLFNLTSSDRVCYRSDVKKLVTPGNVLWMRQKIEIPLLATQELVQLKDKSEFSTSILARTDCLSAHGVGSYLFSLKSVDPNADPDLIDFDFSFLFPKLPERKLEPEFIMLYLPSNVAEAIRGCVEKTHSQTDAERELQSKAQRRLAIKANRQLNKEDTKESELALQCEARIVALQKETNQKYAELTSENKALKEKLAKLNNGN